MTKVKTQEYFYLDDIRPGDLVTLTKDVHTFEAVIPAGTVLTVGHVGPCHHVANGGGFAIGVYKDGMRFPSFTFTPDGNYAKDQNGEYIIDPTGSDWLTINSHHIEACCSKCGKTRHDGIHRSSLYPGWHLYRGVEA